LDPLSCIRRGEYIFRLNQHANLILNITFAYLIARILELKVAEALKRGPSVALIAPHQCEIFY
jgi:hypothetical protein